MSPCKVCSHKENWSVTNAFLRGEIDMYEAARRLDTSYDVFWHHIKKCLKKESEQIEGKGYSEILDDLFKKLTIRCNELLALPVNPSNERMLRLSVQSIMDVMSRISQLKGLVSQPFLQLNQLTVQFNKITSFLVTELCPRCKSKVIKFVEEVKVEPRQSE